MTKNMSFILIAVLVAFMISGALAVTVSTTAFAYMPINQHVVIGASTNLGTSPGGNSNGNGGDGVS